MQEISAPCSWLCRRLVLFAPGCAGDQCSLLLVTLEIGTLTSWLRMKFVFSPHSYTVGASCSWLRRISGDSALGYAEFWHSHLLATQDFVTFISWLHRGLVLPFSWLRRMCVLSVPDYAGLWYSHLLVTLEIRTLSLLLRRRFYLFSDPRCALMTRLPLKLHINC